jgi:sterol desaturase/sphingolipid hydroxylase (fatty acid hydroxylase superfamily)
MDSIAAFFHTLLHYSFVDPQQQTLYSLQESARWLLICAAIFLPLAALFPNVKGQPKLRRDMWSDALFWFSAPLFYRPFAIYITLFLLGHVYDAETTNRLGTEGLPPIRDLPIWVQVILMLLATDILQYWAHRAFHHRHLWRFHSVHHSPKQVDWLSSARFHPVNILLYSTSMNAIVYLIGFSPEAFGTLFLFNMIYSPLVHANLNWTYGPFRYVLASPVFHRWHHTFMHEGGSKNFAPTFPFLDVLFGTFYMPKGKLPMVFGAENDAVPDDFFGQLIYPFKPKAKRAEDARILQSEAKPHAGALAKP